MQKGLDLLGEAKTIIKQGEKIILKPNILPGSDPQKWVTTHPAVFKAVGRVLQQTGATLLYGDSSGIGKCDFNMARASLKQPAEDLILYCVNNGTNPFPVC